MERAGGLLAEGALVVLPTETVYGIAVRADRPEALRALVELKQSPDARAWTWHVGDPSALERFPGLTNLVRRLAARYWPGPLTLVLPGVPPGLEFVAREEWTGVRCVAHRATAGLLARLDFPVVMTSANLAGRPPAVDADEIERSGLSEHVALVVDGGRARLREGSTVLRVGRGRFELLREGLHDLAQLRSAAGLAIGFACTGNTCRSPMAEGLARRAIARRLGVPHARIGEFGFDVRSMGVFAQFGTPAAAHAIEALAERGIDLSEHRSTPAVMEQVGELDALYCLTQSHLDALRLLLPPGKDAHLRLLDPDGGDVPDPIGGTLAEYRACAERIAACIEHHVTSWV